MTTTTQTMTTSTPTAAQEPFPSSVSSAPRRRSGRLSVRPPRTFTEADSATEEKSPSPAPAPKQPPKKRPRKLSTSTSTSTSPPVFVSENNTTSGPIVLKRRRSSIPTPPATPDALATLRHELTASETTRAAAATLVLAAWNYYTRTLVWAPDFSRLPARVWECFLPTMEYSYVAGPSNLQDQAPGIIQRVYIRWRARVDVLGGIDVMRGDKQMLREGNFDLDEILWGGEEAVSSERQDEESTTVRDGSDASGLSDPEEEDQEPARKSRRTKTGTEVEERLHGGVSPTQPKHVVAKSKGGKKGKVAIADSDGTGKKKKRMAMRMEDGEKSWKS